MDDGQRTLSLGDQLGRLVVQEEEGCQTRSAGMEHSSNLSQVMLNGRRSHMREHGFKPGKVKRRIGVREAPTRNRQFPFGVVLLVIDIGIGKAKIGETGTDVPLAPRNPWFHDVESIVRPVRAQERSQP